VHPDGGAVLAQNLDSSHRHAGIARGVNRAHHIISAEKIFGTSAHWGISYRVPARNRACSSLR
jgi:hypothetical protein